MADRPQNPFPGDDAGGDVPGNAAPLTRAGQEPNDPASPDRRMRPAGNGSRGPSPRAMSDIVVASAKVAAIVEAAERAAEDLRLKTEDRARERIAEADRAANLRVDAADAEARDLLDAARREAAALTAEAQEAVRHIHERASLARDEAERRKIDAIQEARDEAASVKAAADVYAEDVKRKAKTDARDIIAEAHDAARGVLRDGTQLSGHLEELSESLRRNAERLLNDVKLAHGRLTADLDQATPTGLPEPVKSRRVEEPPPERPTSSTTELEVPEFLPRRR
jgi:hypothetical protein